MNAIKFRLFGDYACFRKPETNKEVYLTYSNVHKVVILGFLGAIIGLNGYNQMPASLFKKNEVNIQLPEFYTRLNKLKVAIIPAKPTFIHQCIQFSNTTGFANKGESSNAGENLIVTENVLCNPSWEIYILDDNSKDFDIIKTCLMAHTSKYYLYLGRNDYAADFDSVEYLKNLTPVNKQYTTYSSLVTSSLISIKAREEITIDDFDSFYTEEYLPIALNSSTGHYVYKLFAFTSEKVPLQPDTYQTSTKVLQFI